MKGDSVVINQKDDVIYIQNPGKQWKYMGIVDIDH